MKDEKLSDEDARQIKKQYEQALLHDNYPVAEKIETLYKNTPLEKELQEIREEIDEIPIP